MRKLSCHKQKKQTGRSLSNFSFLSVKVNLIVYVRHLAVDKNIYLYNSNNLKKNILKSHQFDSPLANLIPCTGRTNSFGKKLPFAEPQVGDSPPVGIIVRAVARFVPNLAKSKDFFYQYQHIRRVSPVGLQKKLLNIIFELANYLFKTHQPPSA
jgi:hypothetical protein